jgi:hypothetical protein
MIPIIQLYQECLMSRVVNSNSPGKIRNRHRRTIAELLRRLAHLQVIDQEAKDMSASIRFALRGIHESTMKTIVAWEKRDYWTKADRFMRQWEWANTLGNELEELIVTDRWSELPILLAKLMPHFVDIQTKVMTRPPSQWQGAYRLLMSENAE